MIALDRWLEINNKTPFIEDYMKSSDMEVLNLKELKVDILKCISPFIYGKTQLTKVEIDYIDSIFRTKYQLESFYKLYKELYFSKGSMVFLFLFSLFLSIIPSYSSESISPSIFSSYSNPFFIPLNNLLQLNACAFLDFLMSLLLTLNGLFTIQSEKCLYLAIG